MLFFPFLAVGIYQLGAFSIFTDVMCNLKTYPNLRIYVLHGAQTIGRSPPYPVPCSVVFTSGLLADPPQNPTVSWVLIVPASISDFLPPPPQQPPGEI